MTGSKRGGECPLCGDEYHFTVTHDATVPPEIEVPDDAVRLRACYEPEADYANRAADPYYYHWVREDTDG